VLVGLDPSLTYDKLKVALNALVKKDASLLALHTNRLYQDEQGELSPSVGPVVKALEYCSQKEAKVFGKPSPEIYREAMRKFDLEAEHCFMISDDPLSDLTGAKKLGMKTVFVTSGKYKDKEILKSLSEENIGHVSPGKLVNEDYTQICCRLKGFQDSRIRGVEWNPQELRRLIRMGQKGRWLAQTPGGNKREAMLLKVTASSRQKEV